MTEYGLEPAFIKLDYASVFGAHAHLLCTKDWIPTSVSGTMGSYLDWNGTPRDAEAMIDDLVALLAALQKPESSYNLATIYTKAGAGAPALPVASKTLAVVGTSGLTTHAKALQMTMNMRTTGIQPSKIVFLDVPHPATDFNKIPPISWGSPESAIFAELALDGNAWAGRDNTQIKDRVSITWTLNEALRKQYKMG